MILPFRLLQHVAKEETSYHHDEETPGSEALHSDELDHNKERFGSATQLASSARPVTRYK